MRFWIDPLDTELVAHDEDFARQIELAVATGIPPGYKRQSIVPGEDTETENVEISHRVYADRTKSQLGWLTRDYNTTSNTIFKVQSPVIGPDVRVELVVQHQEGTVGLGNYVVISFPAFIYLSDPEIMHQLKMQNLASQRLWNRSLAKHLTNEERAQMQRMAHLTEHNPERWQEDGRIVIAYAHLSEFGPYMFPGQVIDSADKVMIGITGKTGTKLHHLDLLELYVGSSEPGSGALERALDELRELYADTYSQSVEYFFDLAEASQLYPKNNSILYIENIDSARSHPELDTQTLAQYFSAEGDPNDSIYFEDE